ncbi:MAG: double-strand break repair protein AddB [Phenylobacterium sp.]|nr:double-strand break repair protein AddB [Phenylobacterium sp.]
MTDWFQKAGQPRWFNIPADRPFLDDLAVGLLDITREGGPEALADAVVLTPTRRAARSLTEAFLRMAGEVPALLPPRIRPLGDLEAGEAPFEPGDIVLDLPPAISPVRRRFELLRLVTELSPAIGRSPGPAEALGLADALGGFFDSLQIEEVAGDNLADLVDLDMAAHWRVSLEFLQGALLAWPKRLETLGLVDVSARRVRLLDALAAKWDAEPPKDLLIAAGSTGSVKATARLLTVIARAPLGAVVLPGLDTVMAEGAQQPRPVDDQHPQAALRALLTFAGVEVSSVETWKGRSPASSSGEVRRNLVNLALRPAAQTSDWRLAIEGEGEKKIREGLKGLTVVGTRDVEACALAAALLLRETLETPGRTAALVTPDQDLARRVAARLGRWGVIADASAGEPLARFPCAVLAETTALALVEPARPATILGLLKHPHVRLKRTEADLAIARDALEVTALRRTRPEDLSGLKTFAMTAKAADPAAIALVDALAAVFPPTAPGAVETLDASAWARRLTLAMEALCARPEGGTGDLWSGPDGEAVARLLSLLIAEGGASPPLSAAAFAELLGVIIAGESVRAARATHPRLKILGAMEARMARADRLILAGLEEGVWPQAAGVDPFLSRGMRSRLGLPPAERRIALSAHDFAQSACAPEVFLLHARRRRGAPALESRWLWRLRTLTRGAGGDLPGRPDLEAIAGAADAPGDFAPAPRPAPRPPLEARPRELAVTRIETLVRDPYAVWARDILRLYPLDRPDAPVDVRVRGTAIHAALEAFVKAYPDEVPDAAEADLAALYLDALKTAGMDAPGLARETALSREIAAWVVEQERTRRRDRRRIHVELKGTLTFEAPAGPFTVTAKADRIEVGPEPVGRILDYKTGSPPSPKQVEEGFSPQLTLSGAILAAGGFPSLGRLKPVELAYVQITGRRPAGVISSALEDGQDAVAASAEALEGLKAVIARFDNPGHAYLSRTAPSKVKLFASDYDHLARVREWSAIGGGGES